MFIQYILILLSPSCHSSMYIYLYVSLFKLHALFINWYFRKRKWNISKLIAEIKNIKTSIRLLTGTTNDYMSASDALTIPTVIKSSVLAGIFSRILLHPVRDLSLMIPCTNLMTRLVCSWILFVSIFKLILTHLSYVAYSMYVFYIEAFCRPSLCRFLACLLTWPSTKPQSSILGCCVLEIWKQQARTAHGLYLITFQVSIMPCVLALQNSSLDLFGLPWKILSSDAS